MKKAHEDMKRQANRKRKEIEEWKKGNRVMLSIENLVFKEQPAKKLVERYVGVITLEL